MNSANLTTSSSAALEPILSMDMGLTGGADFLSFMLGTELYGVTLSHVEEIRVWEKPTPIPRAPHFVKGVINLRGMIVPIIDLRQRFGLNQYVKGIAAVKSKHLVLIDIDALFDVEALRLSTTAESI
ncbi:purine-binding chemotaxis protein CheW [Vibrio cholerae]|nr:purine-binding chemotaxis protein CheW [Vibrio cholerae]EGR4110390.1 purine-binding chemotaxis protein CheW [Vibrio cholerae]